MKTNMSFKNIFNNKANLILALTSLTQLILTSSIIYYASGTDLNLLWEFLLTLFLLNFLLLFKYFLTKVISFFALIVQILQLINFAFTGDYIIPDTFLHLPIFEAIGKANVINGLMFLVFCSLLWLPNFILSKFKSNKNNLLFALAISCALICSPPIYSFIHNAGIAYSILIESKEIDFSLAKQFKRNNIPNGKSPIDIKDNNLIIIFMEGTSAIVIRPNITPNAYKLYQKSFVIDNYFCHTAPTHKGIRGQLMSGYQINSLTINDRYDECEALKTVPTLQSILKARNYKTCFVSPLTKNDSLNVMLKKIGFEKVVTSETADIETDKWSYEKMFEQINKYENSNEKYMVCAYLRGPHIGNESPHEIYGNGSNTWYNLFYNQDYWFGRFFEKLEKHGYLKNTLLVYTADHATFPSPSFVKSFDSDCPFFIDKIPLFFYRDGITPLHYNANNKNSLSLAPTLLNMMGIENEENYFLGNSLFYSETTIYQHISERESLFYDTSTGKTHRKEPPKEIKKKIINFFRAFG